ncbi:hypothetical protein H4S07_002147 [Coemansia furcata]|uniref:Uncharacterized protein n=1 Tax=Coemansia furcata TaxID=417177 RepID=A0ACC1LL97_9FUNG|nr:hypothetical protein H4S07_002147 [Coemansia furcata]
MLVRCSLLALLLSSTLAKGAIRGLDPLLASKYVANGAGNFVCLDGSLEIPFARVNDDYCDCPDGSDEPGTSACNNGTFYCANEGHIPARISSSKVNNGVCDPECCDGSNEYDSGAHCPNVCVELGQKSREEAGRRALIEGAGSRRRMELVRQARGQRKNKRDELARKELLLAEAEETFRVAEALKGELEDRENEKIKAQEGRQSALRDQHLPDLIAYRRFLAKELHRMRAHRDALVLLLRSVRNGHNAEYNDAAVSQLITDFAAFTDAYPYMESAALEYAAEGSKARAEREARMDKDGAEQDDVDFEKCRTAIDISANERDTLNDDIATLADILAALRDGYNKNYHDLEVKAAVVGFADYEASREKDLAGLAAQYDEIGIDGVRQRVADATAAFDALLASPPAAPLMPPIPPVPSQLAPPPFMGDVETPVAEESNQELADARSAYWAAHSAKSTLSNEVADLRKLLNDTDLGSDDVYLPVKGECISLDTGEYTYEVCLLDRATQISNKDSSRQDLGSFTGFADDVHRYEHGAKCWNGPERSLRASFVCSDTIAILSITEPEKCEYVAKMTGPFACDSVADPVDDAPPPVEELPPLPPPPLAHHHDEL